MVDSPDTGLDTDHFKRWVSEQDPDETFDYGDNRNCSIARHLRHTNPDPETYIRAAGTHYTVGERTEDIPRPILYAMRETLLYTIVNGVSVNAIPFRILDQFLKEPGNTGW